MSYNDVVARSTSFERIRQPSLKEGAFSSMRWVIRRQIPTWYLYPRLIVCVANTREIAKKLRVKLYPTETGCTGLQFTSSRTS